MGLSSKKTKTTTNQQTTANQTPTNPQWVTDSISGLSGKINDVFAGLDPSKLVPGPDPLQTQAGQAAGGLTTSPNFGQASDILGRVAGAGAQNVQGASLLDGLDRYMSPYTDDVVNTTLAGFDQNAGRTRAQQQLDLAGDATFGGSGGSILRSLTEGELARERAGTEAGLRDRGFNVGAGLSLSDAQLRQQASLANASLAEQALARQGQAATSLADVAGAQGAEERANIGTQASIGEMLRQIAEAQARAPISALDAQTGLMSRLPFDLFKGFNATGSLNGTSTTKQSGAGLGDWLNFFAANASAAASGAGGGS